MELLSYLFTNFLTKDRAMAYIWRDTNSILGCQIENTCQNVQKMLHMIWTIYNRIMGEILYQMRQSDYWFHDIFLKISPGNEISQI